MSEETGQNRTPKKTRTPVWVDTFLEILSQTGNITEARKAANVARSTVYERRDLHPAFAAAWDDAVQEAADRMEREAIRRAVEGVEKPVFGNQGTGLGSGEIGVVREYSDTLLIFMLKGARPEKYREKTGGINLNLTAEELAGMTDEEFAALQRRHGLL